MANFLTRTLDFLTPWDRRGESRRRQVRKKKDEEEQRQVRTVRTNQEPEQQSLDQPLQPKRPTNLFEDLNKNLTLGQNQPNIAPVFKPTPPPPAPGTVIEPRQKPKTLLQQTVEDTFSDKNPVVQGMKSVPREIRSLSQTIDTKLRGKDQSQTKKNTGADRVLFGEAPVTSYQKQSKDLDTAVKYSNKKDNPILSKLKPLQQSGAIEKFGPIVMAGLTVTDFFIGGGKKKAIERLAKEGTEDAIEKGLRKNFKELGETEIQRIKGEVAKTTDSREVDLIVQEATARAKNEANRVNIPVKKDIPVREVETDNLDVPVSVKTPPKPMIRDFSGDATTAGRMPTPEELQTRRFNAQVPARPDRTIEGVTPRVGEAPFKLDENVVAKSQDQVIDDYAATLRDVGEGNGTQLIPDGEGGFLRTSNNFRDPSVGKGRMTKAQWREEAERQLREGKADPALQKAFNEAGDPGVQSLLLRGERPDAPLGSPIVVKQVTDIPIRDETIVPQGLPEIPGTVRATTSAEPAITKAEAVANAPVVSKPVELPREIQEVLDNPKQFNKRQVAAARNQRRLARQMAKTQEDTAEAISRIDAASPVSQTRGQSDEFAPTGKFGTGKRGDAYEKVNREAETKLGREEMQVRSAEDLVSELQGRKYLADGDQRKIEAAKENLVKAGQKDSPLYKALTDRNISDRRRVAQILASSNRVIRKSATADALTNRAISKIDNALTDGTKLTDADYKAIEIANTKFTTARDTARQAEEQFKRTHSKADLDAFKKAKKAEMDADLAAKTTEVNTARRVLKGSKEENAAKVVDDLEKEAELNMMDYVTANQLSGPATGVRNLVGTELAGIENRVGANLRAKIVKGITGENVGGFDRLGARAGRKEGFVKMVGDAKRRSDYAGKNVMKQSQNFGTTINSAGESSLYSTTQSRLKAYYKNQLKDQGVSGERLVNDAEFLRMTDPDEMGEVFMDTAMKSSGLTGIYQKSQKVEQTLAKGLGDWLGKALPPQAANSLAKGMVRIGLGYPTATANFLAQSSKRLLVGLPSAVETGIKLAKGDKKGAALALDRAIKEAGSGVAALTVGVALASADRVSGFYPEDKDERQRWTDEGKSELSIKIGDTWQPIPQGFGMLGLPLIVGAQFQNGGAEAVADMFTDRKKISKLLPTDQAYGFLQILSGDSTTNQDKSFVASTIRSFIPAGSFLNQTAKGLDETANDTTTRSFFRNVYDQVASGIPGLNEASDIPDKVSSTGEPIKNPNLLQTYGGARSVDQKAGVENSEKVDQEINSQVEKIDKYGLLNDPNMKGVLKESGLEALKKAQSGQQLDESEIKALKNGLVKGVSKTGSDTAYLENEQYDTHLAALKLKKDLMEDDKTTKPSDIERMDVAIKKGEVYRDNQVPYDMIEDYKDTSKTEWRNMGNPDHEDYDPEMYEKLWQMDELMTKNGVSGNSDKLDEHKYSVKTSKGRGRGGRGGRGGKGKTQTDFSFGTLKAGTFAPKLKEYASIDSQSGAVPVIRRTRPNIVHKISSSG